MFGKRLNHIRKKRGFTAQRMADLLSISIRTYRNYESEHSYPSLDLLSQIADILNVSIDYLLGRDDFLKSLGVSVDEYQ